ncbi:MAG: Gldg family protein [Desulfohalobiaceae bacterium]|nr:Gldg family protein [Desulfohalobiaceae bacterium]
MTRVNFSEAYLRFALYIVVIVLVNVAGLSLNARIDLTENNRYSLTQLSKDTVSGLREPLTVKAFFSKDMPPQYAQTKRYLRDLLQEYASTAERNFNYEFVEVKSEGDSAQRAKQYGIDPVQVRVVSKDELKYTKVYMGLVLVHGDAVAKIPVVSSSGQLEYLLTSRMQKLRNKVSALLGLEEKIEVSLYLSPSLQEVAPHVGIKGLDQLPERVEKAVEELNERNYDKLTYRFREFEPEGKSKTVRKLDLQTLQWPSSAERGIEAGKGSIGLVLRHGEQTKTLDLLSMTRVPMVGTRYQLVDTELANLIGNNLDSLLGIHQKLGYLTGHDTLPLGPQPRRRQQRGTETKAFENMVKQNYSLQQITLDQGVPKGLQTLVIPGPKKEFSDFQLYQLDQALMQGTNLAVFLDSYIQKQSRSGRRGYVQNTTRLDRLLEHYGLKLENAVVMDERCYQQQLSQEQGGGERPIYFAPKIARKNINHDLAFMKNINGLITYKAAPVQANATRISAQDLQAHPLFSSSKRSWLQKGIVRLRPSLLAPPEDPQKMESYPLAYIASGTFSSYFAGKPVPEKSSQEKQANATSRQDSNATKSAKSDLSDKIRGKGAKLDQSEKPGKIVLVGASRMLTDTVLSSRETERSPNAVFVMNLLDALNNRMQMAKLRSQIQTFNPLEETTQLTRNTIKAVNIAGLPLGVLLFGLAVWFVRGRRRKRIREQFGGNG